MVVMSLN